MLCRALQPGADAASDRWQSRRIPCGMDIQHRHNRQDHHQLCMASGCTGASQQQTSQVELKRCHQSHFIRRSQCAQACSEQEALIDIGEPTRANAIVNSTADNSTLRVLMQANVQGAYLNFDNQEATCSAKAGCLVCSCLYKLCEWSVCC